MSSVSTWKVHFNDGTWRLVTAPPILRDGVMVARMVRAYHQELMKALDGRYIWPVSEAEEISLFAEFSAHYRHLADLVVPGLDPSDLTSPCRHQFFVATETLKHPLTGLDVRGLSGIEQLLGFAYSDREIPEEEQDEGAGDSDLSALTMALLTFQHQDVLRMAHVMSSVDMASVVGYANRKLSEAQQEADRKGDKSGPTEKREDPSNGDDETFTQNKPLILERLQGFGIWVPDGF